MPSGLTVATRTTRGLTRGGAGVAHASAIRISASQRALRRPRTSGRDIGTHANAGAPRLAPETRAFQDFRRAVSAARLTPRFALASRGRPGTRDLTRSHKAGPL